MLSTNDDAYCAGIRAGHRVGEYEGMTDVPKCHYAEGSPEYQDWWKGFGDGTEDFIAWQRAE